MLLLLSLFCALLGIYLIYLEFFMSGALMGIGGFILLMISVFLFVLTKANFWIIIIYITTILFGLFLVAKLALGRKKNKNKNI